MIDELLDRIRVLVLQQFILLSVQPAAKDVMCNCERKVFQLAMRGNLKPKIKLKTQNFLYLCFPSSSST